MIILPFALGGVERVPRRGDGAVLGGNGFGRVPLGAVEEAESNCGGQGTEHGCRGH